MRSIVVGMLVLVVSSSHALLAEELQKMQAIATLDIADLTLVDGLEDPDFKAVFLARSKAIEHPFIVGETDAGEHLFLAAVECDKVYGTIGEIEQVTYCPKEETITIEGREPFKANQVTQTFGWDLKGKQIDCSKAGTTLYDPTEDTKKEAYGKALEAGASELEAEIAAFEAEEWPGWSPESLALEILEKARPLVQEAMKVEDCHAVVDILEEVFDFCGVLNQAHSVKRLEGEDKELYLEIAPLYSHCLYTQGNLDESIDNSDLVLLSEPNNTDVLLTLGKAYLLQGDIAASFKAFTLLEKQMKAQGKTSDIPEIATKTLAAAALLESSTQLIKDEIDYDTLVKANMATYEKAMKKNDLTAAIEALESIPYIEDHVDPIELGYEILSKANDIVFKLSKSGKINDAPSIMFKTLNYWAVKTLIDKARKHKKKRKSVAMFLANFGYFFLKADNYDKAVELSLEASYIESELIETQLQYADAEWSDAEQKKSYAKKYYKNYINDMIAKGKKDKIPQRAYDRAE